VSTQKSYLLTADVASTIADALHRERLGLRLTQAEMALQIHIGPKIVDKLERRAVLRIQSEDMSALQLYFGDRLGIKKVWLSNAR
jgi:hypothetical protein